MKKLIAAIVITLCSSSAFAGPIVEVFTCELNDGKSMSDVNAMMTTFNTMLKKAGLEDSYTAHVGFQQVPVKKIQSTGLALRRQARHMVRPMTGSTGRKMAQLSARCITRFTAVITRF